jgi:hypothetical protein
MIMIMAYHVDDDGYRQEANLILSILHLYTIGIRERKEFLGYCRHLVSILENIKFMSKDVPIHFIPAVFAFNRKVIFEKSKLLFNICNMPACNIDIILRHEAEDLLFNIAEFMLSQIKNPQLVSHGKELSLDQENIISEFIPDRKAILDGKHLLPHHIPHRCTSKIVLEPSTASAATGRTSSAGGTTATASAAEAASAKSAAAPAASSTSSATAEKTAPKHDLDQGRCNPESKKYSIQDQ